MHKNRSPCTLDLTRQLLQESTTGQTDPSQQLRETRLPERANVTLTEANQGGKKVTRFKCDIAKVDIVNRNGRFYPRSAYAAAIAAAQEDLDAGKLWGLLEHADDWYDPMKGRLEKIAGRFDKLSIEGDMVVGEGVIVETASGQDLRALFEGGIAVGISTSGTASVKWLPAKEIDSTYHDPEELIGVIQDDLRLLTVDFVSDPANPSGQARASERTQRPAAPPSSKENTMKWNEKVKKTAERLGLSVEAFVEKYADWANELQNESAVPATSETGTVSLESYRALETSVVGLRSTVESLTTQLQNERRDGIAVTALEAARLPSSGTVKDGDTEVDLDASFRTELIDVSRRADTDEAAREAVNAKISQRKALLGQREGARPARERNQPANLPVGNTSREDTGKPSTTRQVESARSRAGLL